jgi:dTDP-4-dehydrorhamnose reductase
MRMASIFSSWLVKGASSALMRILLFGKNGQVGWELQRSLAPIGDVIAVDLPEIDFTDLEGLRDFTAETKPDLIVNAAAYTAVDKAESEPEIAMRINGEAPGVLAQAARELNIGLFHYSTDYVFDGTKGEPYIEEDEPNPINVYGETKLAGEHAVQESGCMHIILRTSWVYGSRGKNFYLTMLRLAREKEEIRVVDDQIGCPTWCRQIANATAQIIEKWMNADANSTQFDTAQTGIYNFSSTGTASWYQFATLILKTDPGKDEHTYNRLIPIPTSAYPTAAARPKFSVLTKDKVQRIFDVQPLTWQEHLQGCWEFQSLPK